ncbi:MAG: hypothetical protein J07HB67_00826 [halophilic archaeon J07HB67]|nr:MAG: hypothetical protein J07HB67_00826 [halophilic archaeon J07HB67]
MIDRLLGRAELKAELETLREERDSLAAQLDAESDRRREAVRDRQAAEERVNRLETRVETLEDRIETLEGDADETTTDRGHERLARDRLGEVLDRLRSVETGREGALSAAVDDTLPEAVVDALGTRASAARRAAPAVIYHDDAGLVSVALTPPIHPAPFHEWADGFRVDDDWFRPTGRFGFGLVRSDTFAAGVYEATERLSFEGFRSDVTSEHDKGGFSQARFERRREEEIDAHLDRVETALADLETERLILVGESTALSRLSTDATHTATADATGADEAALDDAFRDFWTTELTLL